MLKTGRAVVQRFRTITIKAPPAPYRVMTFLISFPGQRFMSYQPEKENGGSEMVQQHGCWETGKRTSSCRLDRVLLTACRSRVILQTCAEARRLRRELICGQTSSRIRL